MGEPRTCFVIMPMSATAGEHTEDYWKCHFESFLKPLIETTGEWAARRSTALRGDIIKEIISDLVTAHSVVADLTDANPNVYWELGVRQSFRHGTVTIAEAGTKIPFDIGAKGTLFYHPKDHLKMEEFRRQFSLAMASCSSEPQRTDSHVLDTLSGRGTIYELIRRDEAIRRIDAIIDELTSNLHFIDNIMKRAEGNQKAPDKRRYPTLVLRVSCCDLLMTTRYLERDAPFYNSVALVFVRCTAINNMLSQWQQSPDPTEKWLLSSRDISVTQLTSLRNTLIPLRAEIQRRK
jgi:hypothetical protein